MSPLVLVDLVAMALVLPIDVTKEFGLHSEPTRLVVLVERMVVQLAVINPVSQ
jgi:hypothetical protein